MSKAKQFKNVTFWEFVHTEFKPQSAEVEHEVNLVKPGLEFYLVEVHFENTGETRLDAQREPGKTNMGGQVQVEGYLGSTDNVGQYGKGHWRLLSAVARGNDRYDIKAKLI
jgi:hypothetical protein